MLFAIIFTFLLIPLIAGTIDITRVRLAAEDLQDDLNTAAVSAATTYGTSTSLSQAQSAGVRTMLLNQWSVTTSNITNATAATSRSCPAVKISYTTTVPMVFAKAFGVPSISITRSAYGIYHDWTLSNSYYNSTNTDCNASVTNKAATGTFQNGEVEIIDPK